MSAIIRKIETSIFLTERRRDLVHALSWQVVHYTTWTPPTDLYEMQDDYVVRVEVAGMKEADFDVSYADGTLVISGTRPDLTLRRAYHQMEIRTGRFSTTIGLPGPVNVENSRAEYADGFLTVTLPKAESNSMTIQNKE